MYRILLFAIVVILFLSVIVARQSRHFQSPALRASHIASKLGPAIGSPMDFDGYRQYVPDLDAVEYKALRLMAKRGMKTTAELESLM